LNTFTASTNLAANSTRRVVCAVCAWSAALGTSVRRACWAWWPWAIAAIVCAARDAWVGAFAAAAVAALAWILAPRTSPPRYGLEPGMAVGSAAFVASVAGTTGAPFVAGNTFEVLHNGNAFYPRMLDDIEHAIGTITIEAYIYWAGEVGSRFAAALAERARAGVRVMILLDAVGSADIGDDILETLRDGGCQIAWYNPLGWRTIGAYNNRTHRKSLIIAGRIGFTGGAGIADHWTGDAQDNKHWRDLQIRMEGPAVQPLQTGFAQNWLEATGELVTDWGKGLFRVDTARSMSFSGSLSLRFRPSRTYPRHTPVTRRLILQKARHQATGEPATPFDCL